jgi:hypothetical protein
MATHSELEDKRIGHIVSDVDIRIKLREVLLDQFNVLEKAGIVEGVVGIINAE